jgi:hypothetical protein
MNQDHKKWKKRRSEGSNELPKTCDAETEVQNWLTRSLNSVYNRTVTFFTELWFKKDAVASARILNECAERHHEFISGVHHRTAWASGTK